MARGDKSIAGSFHGPGTMSWVPPGTLYSCTCSTRIPSVGPFTSAPTRPTPDRPRPDRTLGGAAAAGDTFGSTLVGPSNRGSMTKWTSIDRDQAAEVARSAVPRLDGDGSSRRMSPAGYPLWLFETSLVDGATLRWAAPETDEAVYVLSGALDVDGARCPPGGAVIVERGAEAIATARGPSTVIHVGSTPEAASSPDSPGDARSGGEVHVVDSDGRFESGTRRTSTWSGSPTGPARAAGSSCSPSRRHRSTTGGAERTVIPRTRSSTCSTVRSRWVPTRSGRARPSPFPPTSATPCAVTAAATGS